MLLRLRRPVAALSLLLWLNTCVSVRQQPASEVIQPDRTVTEKIVGVTLNDGRQIRFDQKSEVVITNDSLWTLVGHQSFHVPVSDVQRVWVERVNKTKTTIAVLGLALAVVAIIGAASGGDDPPSNSTCCTESCPFIYSWDGKQYVFDGEPYGGAISRGLERDDYSRLEHLRPDASGAYRLLVTNEVPETQYTNSMRLVVVDHAPGARFEMDEWGKLHNVTKAVAPASARDQEGRDLVRWLRSTDELIWEPLPSANPSAAVRQEIILTFPKPRAATRASLVAHAGTGTWGSHMIREFLELRGPTVSQWYASLDNATGMSEALRAWNVREELYVLKLDVDEAGTWRTRGLLPGGGPYLTETRVVPLDISAVQGDSIRVRIRPPNGFWALNSFEMAFDDGDQPSAVTILEPSKARTSDARDVLADLRAVDDRYYTMPTTGNQAEVTFAAPPQRANSERSVFVHSRGYYKLHLPENSAGDAATLQRITDEPDAAARLAAQRFASWRVARGN